MHALACMHWCKASCDMWVQGGGSLLRPPVLSRDGELLFVPCASSVLAFSSATGEPVYKLEHDALVTCLCLHPDPSRLYSGTQEGSITLWELETGMAVQRWSLDMPIESLVVVGDSGARLCNAEAPHRPARSPVPLYSA